MYFIRLHLLVFPDISTCGADRYAFGGSRTGPQGLKVGGSAFDLEATKMLSALTL
jgi:hypothetical protein